MEHKEKLQMFESVFAPKPGEKVLFIIDMAHGSLDDSDAWVALREMAQDWYSTFKKMGAEMGFSVDILKYEATGRHNAPIPKEVVDAARRSNLVIAMTQYSASSSLKPICDAAKTITRCASMPTVERRMEETAFRANYVQVRAYATAIERMLNDAVGAEIAFSTRDNLYIDLRYRVAESDSGDCSKTGQFINFPSGEGAKAPYEATPEEAIRLGESRTEGVLPARYDTELVRYVVRQNRIVDVLGNTKKASEMRAFFAENDTRRNIAELGIGCNPNAIVTGNILEDEKVGLHIAYGMSTHLGGKVKSDMHQDIVYAKGCPIEGTTVTLINADHARIELIRDAILQYDLLK